MDTLPDVYIVFFGSDGGVEFLTDVYIAISMCTHEDQCVYGNFNVYRTPQCLYTAGVLKRNKRLRECLDDFLLSKSRKNRLGHFSESSPDISRPDWKGRVFGNIVVPPRPNESMLCIPFREVSGDKRLAAWVRQTFRFL